MFRALRICLPLPLLFLVFSAPAKSQDTTVSLIEALALAQAQAPGGQLVRFRMENKSTVYGFYFLVEHKIVEVEIQAVGTVRKVKDGRNPADVKDISPDVLKLLQKYPGKSKLPAGRLLEITTEALNGVPPASVAYAADGDKLLFKAGDLILDGRTGKILSKGKKKKKK